jgi:hypothetical protein
MEDQERIYDLKFVPDHLFQTKTAVVWGEFRSIGYLKCPDSSFVHAGQSSQEEDKLPFHLW